MKTSKDPPSRSHDATVVELLKEDPEFASVYLAAALEESPEPGGQKALLTAFRHVAEAQRMLAAVEQTGIPPARQESADSFLSIAESVAAAGIAPMSMEEINAGVRAARAERKMAGSATAQGHLEADAAEGSRQDFDTFLAMVPAAPAPAGDEMP